MTTDILIDVKGLEKHFKGDEIKALDGVDQQIQQGRGRRRHWAVRLRQIDVSALPEPAGDPDRRARSASRATDITDAQGCNINTHRQKMGMVFQHFNLFPHMTVLKNMTIAPHEAACTRAARPQSSGPWSCCERVGLEDKASAYPNAALRRPEAARGHRPRAVHGAGGHALRRAYHARWTLRWSARCWMS